MYTHKKVYLIGYILSNYLKIIFFTGRLQKRHRGYPCCPVSATDLK